VARDSLFACIHAPSRAGDDIGSGTPRILLVPSAGRERAGLALAGQF
jgi:hypothetical protein